MGEQTLDPRNQTEGDSKEGIYFGREVPADCEEGQYMLHGPNQWPNSVRPHICDVTLPCCVNLGTMCLML